jgi:hypothetical protein
MGNTVIYARRIDSAAVAGVRSASDGSELLAEEVGLCLKPSQSLRCRQIDTLGPLPNIFRNGCMKRIFKSIHVTMVDVNMPAT